MEVGYRTETFAGSGERKAENVIAYEMFQLGNTDIADTLFDPDHGILKNSELVRIWSQVTGYNDGTLDESELDDDVAKAYGDFDAALDIACDILDEIARFSGYNIRYALWLADKETVMSDWRDGFGFGYDGIGEEDVDEYEIGPVVLSADDGCGGTLYGYEEEPMKTDGTRSWFF